MSLSFCWVITNYTTSSGLSSFYVMSPLEPLLLPGRSYKTSSYIPYRQMFTEANYHTTAIIGMWQRLSHGFWINNVRIHNCDLHQPEHELFSPLYTPSFKGVVLWILVCCINSTHALVVPFNNQRFLPDFPPTAIDSYHCRLMDTGDHNSWVSLIPLSQNHFFPYLL